jgi:hypothetical protein
MKRHYYYIVINTPAGIGGYFFRDEKHPLDPEAMAKHQEHLRVAVQLRTNQMVAAQEIAWTNLVELPEEVAKARWPEDFKQ